MNSDKERLQELMERAGSPGAAPLTPDEQAWLEDFRARYPFFPLTAADPGKLCSPEGNARLDGVAAASADDGFYPPEVQPATPTTLDAIDDFLNTYGHQSAEEDALLERLIFNPIPDYAQQLAAREQSSLPAAPAEDADSKDARIDRFILSQKNQAAPVGGGSAASPSEAPAQSGETTTTAVGGSAAAPSASKPKTEKPGLLSESLAKIYIKTHRYERAYEILNDLSLRFPEKSRYFADQLRFLKILIHNERQLRAERPEKTE